MVEREAGCARSTSRRSLPWLATALRDAAEDAALYAPAAPAGAAAACAASEPARALAGALGYRNNRPHALREPALAAPRQGAAAAPGDGSPRRSRPRAAGRPFEYAQTLLARGRVGLGLGWSGAGADVASAERDWAPARRPGVVAAQASGRGAHAGRSAG